MMRDQMELDWHLLGTGSGGCTAVRRGSWPDVRNGHNVTRTPTGAGRGKRWFVAMARGLGAICAQTGGRPFHPCPSATAWCRRCSTSAGPRAPRPRLSDVHSFSRLASASPVYW